MANCLYSEIYSLSFREPLLETRVSSKQTKINFGSNRNKPKQDLFRVCFGLFRETKNLKIRFVSVFRTTLIFWKNTQIYSLLNWLGESSVCFGLIETLCFGIDAKQSKQTVSKHTEKNEKAKKNGKILKFQ
jgi:hypothetical protein